MFYAMLAIPLLMPSVVQIAESTSASLAGLFLLLQIQFG